MNKFKNGISFIMIGLTVLPLFFCQRNTNNFEKKISIDQYVTDSLEIFFPDTIPMNIEMCDLNQNDAAFSAYSYPIFIYSIQNKKFEKLYTKPTDSSEMPILIDFKLPDSMAYYTMISKKLMICKGNKIIKQKFCLPNYHHLYIYMQGNEVLDSLGIYFALGLRSVSPHQDYYELHSSIPNFARIGTDFKQDTILSLQYHIRESKNKAMIDHSIKYTIDHVNHRIIFCFSMIDTIYSYYINTNQLIKYYVSSPLNFQTYFFNSDTCKDIEVSRINMYNQSSSIPFVWYCNKSKLLLRIVSYFNEETNKKENYLQVLDEKVRLLQNIYIPEKYSRFPVYVNNELYFYLKDTKRRKHVYKKINLHSVM